MQHVTVNAIIVNTQLNCTRHAVPTELFAGLQIKPEHSQLKEYGKVKCCQTLTWMYTR